MASLVKAGGHGKPCVFGQQHGRRSLPAGIAPKARALQRCLAFFIQQISIRKVIRVFRHEITFFTREPEFIRRNNAIL
jgi:hypothetical protein